MFNRLFTLFCSAAPTIRCGPLRMRRCKSQNPCAVHLTRRSSLQGLVLVWAIFSRSDAGRPFLIFIRSQYLAQLDEEVESTRPSHIGMEEGTLPRSPPTSLLNHLSNLVNLRSRIAWFACGGTGQASPFFNNTRRQYIDTITNKNPWHLQMITTKR